MFSAEDNRAVRAATKGTDWVARAGAISARKNGTAFHAYEFAGWYRFIAKPIVWDQIFWSIMRLTVRPTASASRHFWGPNCPVKSIRAAKAIGRDAPQRAGEILAFADAAVSALKDTRLTVSYLKKKAIEQDRADDFAEAEVVECLANGDTAAARAICADVLGQKRRASHVHQIDHDGVSYSFFDLAAKWTPKTA